MAAPDYVPVNYADKARAGSRLPPPRRWTATRPADLTGSQPKGPAMGRQGPDQGYAMHLVRNFEPRLVMQPGEHREDAVAGGLAVAMARASVFGRAPVSHDLELAFALWGFLPEPGLPAPPPADLVEYRKPLFAGAAHHYWAQRGIVDRVAESTLRMTPAQVRQALGDWRNLLLV